MNSLKNLSLSTINACPTFETCKIIKNTITKQQLTTLVSKIKTQSKCTSCIESIKQYTILPCLHTICEPCYKIYSVMDSNHICNYCPTCNIKINSFSLYNQMMPKYIYTSTKFKKIFPNKKLYMLLNSSCLDQTSHYIVGDLYTIINLYNNQSFIADVELLPESFVIYDDNKLKTNLVKINNISKLCESELWSNNEFYKQIRYKKLIY